MLGNALSLSSLLFTVLYILNTCRLQVTQGTKGALNSSQSEEARCSIIPRDLNTCLNWPFYSNFLYRFIAPLRAT